MREVSHVVEMRVSMLYKVYVDDPDDSMTKRQIINKAKEMAIEDTANLGDVDGFEIEPQDILSVQYLYDID